MADDQRWRAWLCLPLMSRSSKCTRSNDSTHNHWITESLSFSSINSTIIRVLSNILIFTVCSAQSQQCMIRSREAVKPLVACPWVPKHGGVSLNSIIESWIYKFQISIQIRFNSIQFNSIFFGTGVPNRIYVTCLSLSLSGRLRLWLRLRLDYIWIKIIKQKK